MSSKVSNQTTGGRRTPLSLGPASAQKSNQKLNTESSPPDSTTIDLKHRKSDDKSPKLEKTDSPAKNSSAKETTNNVSDNKKEKTSKKDSQNSHENGHGDNKDEKLNSQKEENSKKLDKKLSRESPRNKDVLKTDAKDNNKETEKTKITNITDKEKDKRATPIDKKENNKEIEKIKTTISTRSKSPDKEKEKRTTGAITITIKDKNNKNDDSKKIDEVVISKKIDEVAISKRSSRTATLIQQATKQTPNISGGSLALQTEFQGFHATTENDVEMESLLLDVDIPESATTIPTAAKTLSHSPALRSSRRSINDEGKDIPTISTPRRSARKEIESFLPPTKLPAIDIPVTSTPEGKTFYSLPPTSLRQISGRRSLRPLKEYTFQYNTNYREAYRPINTELDYTNNTSLNVTVGSESPPQNESFISALFSFGRGKKRALTPPQKISTTDEIQDDAVNTNTASPKRPKLDLSGLIGLVASPVTMLKTRLYRTKIDSSTPNNKTEEIDDIDVDEDGISESVSEIIADEKKILLEEEHNKNNTDPNDNDDTGEFDVDDESDDSIEKEKSVEHLNKIEIGDEAIAGSNEADAEGVAVVNSNRRGRCSIM